MIKYLLIALSLTTACFALKSFPIMGEWVEIKNANWCTNTYVMKVENGWIMQSGIPYGLALVFIPDVNHVMNDRWEYKE